MQLDEYALRVLRFADPTGRQDHAAAVAERMVRQRILYDRSKQLTFLITEGALRWRPVRSTCSSPSSTVSSGS